MRAEGYTYPEIACKVGLSKSTVNNMVVEIEQRFNKLYY
jgi:DNA-binding NarL/FixJ family response regulator